MAGTELTGRIVAGVGEAGANSVCMAQRWPGATLLVWHGMLHVFAGFDFLPESRAAIQRIGRFMRERLAGAADGAALAQAADETAAAGELAAEDGRSTLAPRRLSAQARIFLAIAVATGFLWLAVVALGMGPLPLLVHPLVWAAALSLGAIWALAVVLFLRAALRAPRGRPSG